ncbi:ADP-ribose pyrophosphatase [Salsuginibacillus halophilus]|uniref:ADP-ribose pyrophosphatase n=1 Tax=Salsuginibacillus halophilus TaxID=517424 RepID=A0A2P8HAP0_9BACI|nr:NUDIX hydrolase [Salsuginibacillus halophilus]PSL43284.1 ADP-ribose pyrophosphatase [Salsuginibacillus halophilus]
MRDLTEETMNKETIYEGRVFNVELHDVKLPNGETSRREVVKHPGAVAIAPVTSDNKILLVQQFRKPLEKMIYELPAGKREAGEEAAVTARRELEEETGVSAEALHWVTSFYTSPGFADELIDIYTAEGLTTGEAHTEEDEFVNVVELSLEEAEKLVENGGIHDAKTAFVIQYLRLQEMKNRLG